MAAVACVLGAACLGAVAPAGAVTLSEGDIVVLDVGDFSEPAKLVRVDPATGQQTLISDNSVSGPNLFQGPQAVDAASDGTLLVTNYSGTVVAVDPATGQQSLVSDNTISGPNLLSSPVGIRVDPTGRILVTDDGNDSVVAIDRATGQQSLVTDDATSANDLLTLPFDIDFDAANNRIVVADFLSGFNGDGMVIGIDAAGQQAIISDNDINTGTDYFANPKTLTLDNNGQILVVSYNSRALVRIDGTGQQILISDDSTSTVDHFFLPYGLAVEESGRILVADTQNQGVLDGNVIAVDPATGEQTVFSDNTISDANLLFDPEDITVMGEIVPPTPPGG
jgi:outer membrane protein assembly factor BamB